MEWNMNRLSSRLLTTVGAGVIAAATLPAGAAVITQWSFTATVAAPDNSPPPTTGSGTAVSLGMTNAYTYTTPNPDGTPGTVLGTGAVTGDDITKSTGVITPPLSEYTWRIRGAAGTGTTGTGNNGWNLQAPQYSQGAELDVSTAGYTGITFSYDWYSTAQGVRDLQEQYNLNTANPAGWTNIDPLRVAVPNDYYSTSTPNLTIDLTGIAGASNDPTFGIRLVSAADPTYAGPAAPAGDVDYTSATLVSGASVLYNNNSGNWRFDNVTFSGTAVPEPATLSVAALAAAAIRGRRRRTAR
jgi:hypothetical protein